MQAEAGKPRPCGPAMTTFGGKEESAVGGDAELLPHATGEGAAGLLKRLEVVRTTLRSMGATQDYCRRYFQACTGRCDDIRNGVCVRHTIPPLKLPDHIMGQADLRTQVGELKYLEEQAARRVVDLRERWKRVCHEETGNGFLAVDGCDLQSSGPQFVDRKVLFVFWLGLDRG